MSLTAKPKLFVITGSNGAGKSTLKQSCCLQDIPAWFAKGIPEIYKLLKI